MDEPHAVAGLRLVADPHLWATTLYDELVELGYGGSYPTFTRVLRTRQLRPVCATCRQGRVADRAVISHPPGEETQWDWLELPDPPPSWGWSNTAYVLIGSLPHSGRWRGWLAEATDQAHLVEGLDAPMSGLLPSARPIRYCAGRGRRQLNVFVDPLLIGPQTSSGESGRVFNPLVEHLSASPWVKLRTYLAAADTQTHGGIERLGIEFADDRTPFMHGSPDAAQPCHIASRSKIKERAAAASRRTSVSAENWYEALVTLDVAESAGSDILVTERADTLLSRDPSVGSTDSKFIVTRAAAVSFLGLYFREHEEWGELPPPSVRTSRKEWLARRTAVHAMLDWEALGHLRAVSPATGDPALHTKADSLIKRVITATSIRDRICADAMKPPSHGRHESISAHLEWLALTLSGAFDSLALTVNDHLGGCKRDKRSVSWTNKDCLGSAGRSI